MCGLSGKVTGNSSRWRSGQPGRDETKTTTEVNLIAVLVIREQDCSGSPTQEPERRLLSETCTALERDFRWEESHECEPTAGNTIKVAKLSSVSTGQLRWLPTLHIRPINLVVFQGTSGQSPTKPDLGHGFALICFQRLSEPYLATLRCHGRDNRNTRGTSLQILSY